MLTFTLFFCAVIFQRIDEFSNGRAFSFCQLLCVGDVILQFRFAIHAEGNAQLCRVHPKTESCHKCMYKPHAQIYAKNIRLENMSDEGG